MFDFSFNNVHNSLTNLRRFSYFNKTFFEFIFILIYAIEQIILILLTFRIKNLIDLTLIVSLFAVIFLTTFAIHKLIMDSRSKILEKKVNTLQKENFEINLRMKTLSLEHFGVIGRLESKDLNSRKNSKKIKEVD